MTGVIANDVGMFRKIRRFGIIRCLLVIAIPTLTLWLTLKCIIYLVLLQQATHSAVRPGPRDCQTPGKGAQFPKFIHQTWKYHDIPKQWNSSVQSCKYKNPNYEYKLWTDTDLDDFLEKEYPWFLDTYHSYMYIIQKIDAARLFLLYHYGGIYMDLDIVCLESWDKILANRTGYDAILVETTPWGVTNYIMAAKPRDPFIWYLIEGLRGSQDVWYVIKYATVIFSTGPMMISDRLMTWEQPEKVQVINLKERDEVFGNLHGSSWHTWDGVIIYGFSKHYKFILKVSALVLTIFGVTAYVLNKLYKTSLELKKEKAFLTEKQLLELGLTKL